MSFPGPTHKPSVRLSQSGDPKSLAQPFRLSAAGGTDNGEPPQTSAENPHLNQEVGLTTELTCDTRSEAPWPVRRTRDWGRNRVPCVASDWPCVVKWSDMLCFSKMTNAYHCASVFTKRVRRSGNALSKLVKLTASLSDRSERFDG